MVSVPVWSSSPSSARRRRSPPVAFLNTPWGRDEADGLHDATPPSRAVFVKAVNPPTSPTGQCFPNKGALSHLPDFREATYRRMSLQAESLGLDAPDREDVYKYADRELPMPPPSAGTSHGDSRKPRSMLDMPSTGSVSAERPVSEDVWIEEAKLSTRRERRRGRFIESSVTEGSDYRLKRPSSRDPQAKVSTSQDTASSKSGTTKRSSPGTFADRMRGSHLNADQIAKSKPRGYFGHYVERESGEDHRYTIRK